MRLPLNSEQQTYKLLTSSCSKETVSPTKASAEEDQAVKMFDGQHSYHDYFQELKMTQQLLQETKDKVDKLTTANEVVSSICTLLVKTQCLWDAAIITINVKCSTNVLDMADIGWAGKRAVRSC